MIFSIISHILVMFNLSLILNNFVHASVLLLIFPRFYFIFIFPTFLLICFTFTAPYFSPVYFLSGELRAFTTCPTLTYFSDCLSAILPIFFIQPCMYIALYPTDRIINNFFYIQSTLYIYTSTRLAQFSPLTKSPSAKEVFCVKITQNIFTIVLGIVADISAHNCSCYVVSKRKVLKGRLIMYTSVNVKIIVIFSFLFLIMLGLFSKLGLRI